MSVGDERRFKILEYLTMNSFATVVELVELVRYSESTIKRDLTRLESEGKIRRTRGGAVIIDTEKIDVAYLTKLDNHLNDEHKKAIAQKATFLIKDDMTIFIDSSTTVLHLVPILTKFKGLRVITNSVLTATLLSEYTSVEVIVIGGAVTTKKFIVNSPTSLTQLEQYHFDLSFSSCRGYSLTCGATENSEGEAIFKQRLTQRSQIVVLMVLQKKLGYSYTFSSLTNDKIHYLLTEGSLQQSFILKLKALGIKTVEGCSLTHQD